MSNSTRKLSASISAAPHTSIIYFYTYKYYSFFIHTHKRDVHQYRTITESHPESQRLIMLNAIRTITITVNRFLIIYRSKGNVLHRNSTSTDGPFLFMTHLSIRRKDPFFYISRMIVSRQLISFFFENVLYSV